MTNAHLEPQYKQYGPSEWYEHYQQKENYDRLFADRITLTDKSKERGLSSSERAQLQTVETLILHQ